jgi:WD40 repeat protein
VNLDGPVRVPDAAGSGKATIILSFKAWKGVNVEPTTHSVTILPPRAGPKTEPTSPQLVASLVHPDRKASLWGVNFSADGARLLAFGYRSGIVQIWDLASRKELHRIDTPPGPGSAEYAVMTPDWKTLYVPFEKRSVKPFERGGRRLYRIEYGGQTRVWDVSSGKEKDPLLPSAGSAPIRATLAPGGRFLLCVERPTYESGNRPKDVTVVWDLATHKKWKLTDGAAVPAFAPDGKSVVVSANNYETKDSALKLLELTTGKELAKVSCPEKGR